MIDAYTIGITLALDDGISAGIAAVRRDLLALDRVIGNTAAGLLALRRLGQQVSIVRQDPTQSTLSQVSPTARVSRGSAAPEADTLSPSTSDAPREAAKLPALPLTNTGAFRAIPNLLDTPPTPDRKVSAAPAATLAALNPPPTTESGTPDGVVEPPDQRTPAGKAEPRPRTAAEFAPRPLGPPQPVTSEPRPAPALPAEVAGPVSPILPVVTIAPGVESPAIPSHPEAPPAYPTPNAPSRARPEVARSPKIVRREIDPDLHHAAPTTHRPPAHASEDRLQRPQPESRSFSEPPRSQDTADRDQAPPAGVSGDISLDGMRLGRWMADSLARMTERPPSGSTGVDPRTTPTWPAMQGN